ncbi:MAG: transaldolase, partial [Acidobacteriota bacterium]
MNPLKTLLDEGQSLWLDYIRASLLESGELQRMISEDGLRGMTSNPTIFQKAITQGDNYDGRLRKLLQDNPNAGEAELFEKLAVQDIGRACDILRPVYDDSNGADGFVSIEVSPLLARDTEGTVQEARRLWREVDHPNVMIKVPATPEGIPAIETLIGEDIHVNVTLMFSLKHYEAVAHAYLRGLEKASRPAQAASVASFFVSRVDTKIDEMLDSVGTEEAASLKGRVAVANAKIAYRRFQQLFHGEAFKKFREEGVHVQRPLWASTSTKNPAYSDVLYVEELIGPDTVNTMPPETIDAFRDHGKVSRTVTEGVDEAKAVLEKLARLGIDLDKATEALQEE